MYKETYSVLLVDDEAYTRKMIGERISKIPNVTLAASLSNGVSAKRYLIEHVVDIVITDIQMPLMDGLELAAFVKELMPSCPVVIISGFGEFEYARKAIKYGVIDYLLKPIQFKQIAEIIEKSCEEVRKIRKQTLFIQQKQEDEQRFYESLSKGNPCWKSLLNSMGRMPGTIIRLETETKDKDCSMVYKNIIEDALPGQKILRLHNVPGKYVYLVFHKDKGDHRSVKSLEEYLNRVLEQSVIYSEIGNVYSVDELEANLCSLCDEQHNEAISAAIQYIDQNLSALISRDDVAEHVFLSPNYFSYLFKQVTGMAYSEYLTKIRIEKACKLLGENMTVREVACSVGIHDPKYFSDLFYRNTGCLPSDYRRKLLRENTSGDSR